LSCAISVSSCLSSAISVSSSAFYKYISGWLLVV
jgi:hypothetical protein